MLSVSVRKDHTLRTFVALEHAALAYLLMHEAVTCIVLVNDTTTRSFTKETQTCSAAIRVLCDSQKHHHNLPCSFTVRQQTHQGNMRQPLASIPTVVTHR